MLPNRNSCDRGRLHDFLSSYGGRNGFLRPVRRPRQRNASRRSIVKTRYGRVSLLGWQSVVGSGAEMCTRSVVCDLTPEREWKAALRSARRFQRFFCQRAGRQRATRPVWSLRGGEPRARRVVRHRAQGSDRTKADRLVNEEDRSGIAAKLAATAEGQSNANRSRISIAHPRET